MREWDVQECGCDGVKVLCRSVGVREWDVQECFLLCFNLSINSFSSNFSSLTFDINPLMSPIPTENITG